MKKSMYSLVVVALMSVGVAHADTAPAANTNDLFRFDVSCSFGSVGCSAESRLFLNIRGDNPRANTVNPQWFGPLLAVSCRGELISASDAQLFRQDMEDGVRWEIFNSDQTVEIDLKDHPFNPNGATNVPATLEIDHHRSSGTCNVVAHEVNR